MARLLFYNIKFAKIVKESQKGGLDMAKRSVVDEIDHYLKVQLQHHDMITLNRREIALKFNCVPSQINYVINTRFTKEQGYIVESKRGGGGYIRIQKLYFCVYHDALKQIQQQLPQALTYEEAATIIHRLFEAEIIDKKIQDILMIAVHPEMMSENKTEQRSRFLNAVLQRLQYK